MSNNQSAPVLVTKPNTVSAKVSAPVVKTTSNTFSKQGIAGPKGEKGEKGDKGDIGNIGPEGPEYQGDDLPDFTLIFDNKLI